MTDTQGTTRAPEGANAEGPVVYAGVVPVTSVTCPSWCVIPQQEHLDNLRNLEGMALHRSEEVAAGEGSTVHITVMSYVDGTPVDPETEPPGVNISHSSEPYSLVEANRYGRAVLDACAQLHAHLKDSL